MKKIIIFLNLILYGAVSPLAYASKLSVAPSVEQAPETLIIARPPWSHGRPRRRPRPYRVYPHNPTVIKRTVIINPRRIGKVAWAWNAGRIWYPRDNYWGGGFWGGFVIGAVTGGIIGAITADERDTYIENNYYTVERGTPGYTLLSDYELVQTRCTKRNDLVIINGPKNSQICAFPNDIVSSGVYSVDVSNLTLVPDS